MDYRHRRPGIGRTVCLFDLCALNRSASEEDCYDKFRCASDSFLFRRPACAD